MIKKPTKQIHKTSENTVESKYTNFQDMLKAGGDNNMTDVWKDFFGGFDKKVGEQVGFLSSGGNGHEMKPGEEVSLKKQEKAVVRSEAHMEYFRTVKNADVAPKHQEDAALERQVNDIRLEIKQLIAESKQLESAFKTIQIDQKVVKAGVYHQTLFAFLKSLIHTARVSLKEGASWMNTTKTKKQQQSYTSMAQKHGTSFTLNNERSLATQVG